MSVDRSLLPPLPGKPDWYVDNAPAAVEHADATEPAVVRSNGPWQNRTLVLK
jgi:hypothetical protein